jgi:hypothetical protein
MEKLSYSGAMGDDGAHIRLKLNNSQPIALADFVGEFVGIGNQFDKFIARDFPNIKADSEIFVKEVRSGSIEADLVALVTNAWAAAGTAGTALLLAGDAVDKIQILSQFVGDLKNRISPYFRPGGRHAGASKGDLNDFLRTVQAVATDPDGSARIEAAAYEDGERNVRVGFQFSTTEAREAEKQIKAHKEELEAASDADYSRVMMRFVRPSIEHVSSHKRTGERAVIEAIHPKPLAVLYASDMARERIQFELKEGEANPFNLLFDVDVNVEISRGRPVAYRVTNIHDVTDAPEDD